MYGFLILRTIVNGSPVRTARAWPNGTALTSGTTITSAPIGMRCESISAAVSTTSVSPNMLKMAIFTPGATSKSGNLRSTCPICTVNTRPS